MAEFSDYMENAIINQMRNVAGVQVAVYVALFTADTGLEADDGWADTEVDGAGYSRQLAGLSAADAGASANAAAITFGPAEEAWGTVTHLALMDAATEGHVLMWSPLDVAKPVGDGDTLKFLAGELDVAVA